MSSNDEIRLSQLIQTFGPGSIVDLPEASVMIMGLDSWPIAFGNQSMRQISEPRLVQYLTKLLSNTEDGQPALRQHRAVVRGFRHRRRDRHRTTRPHHLGALGAGCRDDRRAGQDPRRARRRALPGAPLQSRAAQGDPLRRSAPRLWQGRGPRAGAGQGQETLSRAARADPQPPRLHPPACRARPRPTADRAPRDPRSLRLRPGDGDLRGRARDAHGGPRPPARPGARGQRTDRRARGDLRRAAPPGGGRLDRLRRWDSTPRRPRRP